MNRIFILSTILTFAFFSCNEQTEEKKNTGITDNFDKVINLKDGTKETHYIKSPNDKEGYWVTEKGDVQIIREKYDKGTKLTVTYKNHRRIINLPNQEEGAKEPIVSWISPDFICFHTYWKNTSANDFFIDYTDKCSIRFMQYPILAANPNQNIIVSVQTTTLNEYAVNVYSLKTKKSIPIAVKRTVDTKPLKEEDVQFENNVVKIITSTGKIYTENYNTILK